MSKLVSVNPSNGSVVYEVDYETHESICEKVSEACEISKKWGLTSIDERVAICERFTNILKESVDDIALVISEEMGKPVWEAKTEINAAIGKLNHSIRALDRVKRVEIDHGNFVSVTDFKPLGVVAILGPFNFPFHLLNSQIVPALLMGNCVVFKPSHHTPFVGQCMFDMWDKAGLPKGVMNIVQGGADVGSVLCTSDVDGVFFTGSYEVGCKINKSLADRGSVDKVLALEMGGNNPLVVWDFKDDDVDNIILNIIESSFITSGQRCVCARRLYIKNPTVNDGSSGDSYELVRKLVDKVKSLKFSDALSNPSCGPLVSIEAAQKVLSRYFELIEMGGKPLLKMRKSKYMNALLYPGIVDMTDAVCFPDFEIFGPLLQIYFVDSFEDAVCEANRTKYGLSASLFTSDIGKWKFFKNVIKAGIVNLNKPTTGALGENPFGGVGRSGNHRPSGFFASDYCCYPVASVESDIITTPSNNYLWNNEG